VTRLLAEASGGNADALNRLVPLVYDELRKIAHAQLRRERAGHTLNTTALVHEAYVKLVDQDRVEWRDRTHFYGVAAQAMRRILVNYAEARGAQKRGGGSEKVPLDESLVALDDAQLDELLALDQALNRLQAFNPRGARVVEYRFFAGLQHDEVAEIMELSTVTVRRAWSAAKSWLRQELSVGAPDWASRLAPGGEDG
jgi:RNA polymerase sigma factor (TIGR02999 family)